MDLPVPGLVPDTAVLFDERRRPDFRDVFGALARGATDIAVAVTRARLSTIDLSEDELEGVRRMRVLVAEVSALRLDAEARGLRHDRRRAPNVELLQRLLEAERLQVRSAPLAGWAPDFSVFSGPDGASAVLLGFHIFERPYPHRGPAFGLLHSGDAARLAAARHAELWEAAHDIGPAIWSILSRARPRTLRPAG